MDSSKTNQHHNQRLWTVSEPGSARTFFGELLLLWNCGQSHNCHYCIVDLPFSLAKRDININEFFQPTVTMCLLKGGFLIVGVFFVLMVVSLSLSLCQPCKRLVTCPVPCLTPYDSWDRLHDPEKEQQMKLMDGWMDTGN